MADLVPVTEFRRNGLVDSLNDRHRLDLTTSTMMETPNSFTILGLFRVQTGSNAQNGELCKHLLSNLLKSKRVAGFGP